MVRLQQQLKRVLGSLSIEPSPFFKCAFDSIRVILTKTGFTDRFTQVLDPFPGTKGHDQFLGNSD